MFDGLTLGIGFFLLAMLAAFVVYKRRRFVMRARTLCWPVGLSRSKAEKYLEYFLRMDGWALEGGRPDFAIPFCAIKNGYRIYFYIPEPGLSLRTQIRDVDECAYELNQPIAVIDYGRSENAPYESALTPRVFVVSPEQIKNLLEIHHAHRAVSNRALLVAKSINPD